MGGGWWKEARSKGKQHSGAVAFSLSAQLRAEPVPAACLVLATSAFTCIPHPSCTSFGDPHDVPEHHVPYLSRLLSHAISSIYGGEPEGGATEEKTAFDDPGLRALGAW